MCEFLLESPECKKFADYVHEMDDFYEKPIDHLCNSKGNVPVSKKPLADYLQYFMDKMKPDAELEA
jgi:hypothetical protein